MREEARRWLAQAEHDLKTAKVLLQNDVYDFSAFAAFQCAEKALKAAYVHVKNELPPKTHELMALAKAVGADETIEAARELNPHFVQSRYPDAANGVPFETYSRHIARRCVARAEKVFEWVKKKIG